MIVRDNEVTLTKKELKECIVECSEKVASKIYIDEIAFVLMQGLIAVDVANAVTKKIFGEKNND